MKAITYYKYGSPDVLHMEEIAKPIPADNEVLIKIHATAANPLDWHIMRAAPVFVRFSMGLTAPKFNILGADIAGVVEAVGSNVLEFQPGDAVFGEIGKGGFAEYVTVKADQIALKPENLTFEEAAAVGVVGFTAIQGLRDTGKIQAGQKVLINGASGGVGSFAVQYAKAMGAEVTAVCSGRNAELVKSIGADHAIDYTKEDFTLRPEKYDLLYDAIGNLSLKQYKRALTPDGKAVIAGFTTMSWMFSVLLFAKWTTRNSNNTIGMMPVASPNKDDLLYIKDLLEAGKVKAVIDKCYPFEETAEAMRYLETGRARGKVIVNITS